MSSPGSASPVSPVDWIRRAIANPVGRNSAFSALGYLVPALEMIIATPFLVRGLGTAGYGVWVFASALLGVMGIFDLGLATAIAKYVAEYREKGDIQALSSTVTMGTLLYLILGIVLTVAGMLVAPLLGEVIHRPDLSGETVRLTGALISLGLLPLFLKNAGLAVPIGLQRYQVPMIASVAQTTLVLGLAAGAVSAGASAVSVVASTVVAYWLVAIGSLAVGYRQFRGVGGRVAVSAKQLRIVARFLAFSAAGSLGRTLFSSVDRVLVGAILGASAVAYYSVSVGIAVNLLTMGDVLAAPLMPAASAWMGADGGRQVGRWLRRATKIIGALEVTAASALLLLSKPFLTLWLGDAFAAEALPTFRVLVVAYAVIAIGAPAHHMANGLGRPWTPSIGSILGGVLTLSLIAILAPQRGVTGAALANLGYCASTAFVLVSMLRWRPPAAAGAAVST